jgi:hypothetical protein
VVSARTGLVAAAFVVLAALRVPAVVQPAGGDQGLYAYVGQRILAGELPYRDAWDQKPPAVHFAYAVMQAAWPDLRVVAATDLLLSLITTVALVAVGSAFGVRGGGIAAGLLHLGLANPMFGRLGGVRVRAQCEVFIAALVTLALWAAWTSVKGRDPARRGWAWLAGICIGLAVTFKYNAATYGAPAMLMLAFGESRGGRPQAALALIAGAALPPLAMVAVFATGGALGDLVHATYSYNLLYSGETYRDAWHFVSYLVSFPVGYSWVDSLWWMGGLGSAALVVGSFFMPRLLVAPAWVAAACLSIAVNGSRGLPQYFVQAWPALALAAGLAVAMLWQRISLVPRVIVVSLIATGVWRVTPLPKAADYWWHDVKYITGQLPRDEYLSRFGGRATGDKYSALAIDELASYLRAHTQPADRVLVFGFSPAALVEADRVSATRFFWSRPVIVGFREGKPGYGPTGMLQELERSRPSVVVLQRHDWDPDGPDSWTYFTTQPQLAGWLHRDYVPASDLGNFAIWKRRAS